MPFVVIEFSVFVIKRSNVVFEITVVIRDIQVAIPQGHVKESRLFVILRNIL